MQHLRRILVVLVVVIPTLASADAPGLREAFGRGTPGAGGVSRGTDLLRVDVPTARYADALCADGSAPVLYVRAAASARHRDDWVVFLQGGGACNSGPQCHDRWLGRDGNFGANKLSSTYAPTGGIATAGIGGRDPRNPFAGWNQVFVYYCSSDGWSGRARNVELDTEHQGQPVRYRMHLLGASIVDAAFDLLRGGAGPVRYRDRDGATRTLPDLDDARTLLFAGSSAGGAGVLANADRIGALLHRNRPSCPGPACTLRYAAVVDASYGLATRELDHAGTDACGAGYAGQCTYEASMRWRWDTVQLGLRRGVPDESCVAHHAANGEAWRCADADHVIIQHLATPLFVRADLQDRLVMGNMIEAGFGYQGLPLDRALYGSLHEIQLRELPAAMEAATNRPAGPAAPPGVFGPQCGGHETLQRDASLNQTIADGAGRGHDSLAVLANWLAGRQPSVLVESFDPAGPAPGCTQR